MRKPLAVVTLVAVFVFSVLMVDRTDVNSSNAISINVIGQASTTVTTETYTITSIYSYTVSSTSTMYTTTTTASTATQTAVTVSTISTTTTTTDTSTSWRVQTSTSITSRTSTIVEFLTSLTTTSLTDTSTSLYPTVTVTSMNTSYRTTTVFSPLVTVPLVQTSVIPMASLVTTALSTTTTATTTTTIARPCLIASAAYGSELAPHVQFLREFRDRTVMSTFAGAQFMHVFNAFYYSFSPVVAQATLANPSVARVVRTLISPLIISLRLTPWILPVLSQNTELATLFAGVAASGLIGMIYGTPIAVLKMIRKRRSAYNPAPED